MLPPTPPRAVEITIRPARASDGPTAAPLVWSSGPSLLAHTYGPRGRQFVGVAFEDGRGFLGWRNHTVAVLDGEVVGVIAFYGRREYRRLTRESVRQALSHFSARTAACVVVRSLQVRTLMPPPSRSTHYAANLGVAPAVRSRGIGAALIAHGHREAARLGRATYELDVTLDNPRAQALYERLGFVVTGHQLAPRPTLPGARRMVRSVSAAAVAGDGAFGPPPAPRPRPAATPPSRLADPARPARAPRGASPAGPAS